MVVNNELLCSINKHKELSGIDITKFICSIFVLVMHIPIFVDTNPGEITAISEINFWIQNYITRLAVPFFFIASGYFIFRKYNNNSFFIRDLKKPLYRFFSLYIIWTIVYSPIIICGILEYPKGLVKGLLLWIRSFLVIGSYRQLWYINALIIAVLIVGILLHCKISIKKIVCISLVAYFVGLFGCSYYYVLDPLRNDIPVVKNILNVIGLLIGTTRNGLFFGFPFVAFGAFFAYKPIRINIKTAIILFFVSLCFLAAEVMFIKTFSLGSNYDNLIFLLPSSFLMFYIVAHIDIKCFDNKKIRSLSSLIYFTHLFINYYISKFVNANSIVMGIINPVFIFALPLTIIISIVIYKLSEKYPVLKKIY